MNVYVALAGELTYQKRLPATWKVEILDQGPIIRIFCTMQLSLWAPWLAKYISIYIYANSSL